MNTKRLPRLCLVEDDQIMGESLADRFRLEGFEVDWHRRAGEAHRAIGRVRYDLVLTDVRLPDFTGEILYIRLLEELGKEGAVSDGSITPLAKAAPAQGGVYAGAVSAAAANSQAALSLLILLSSEETQAVLRQKGLAAP